jgi:UDP-N-acetylglucosamine 3-dehydrogenase
MQSKLKVAVIGVGNMGKHHAGAYALSDKVVLVGVADPDTLLGKRIARQYKTHYYTDHLELLKHVRPDLVSVCVPTSLHFTVSSSFLKYGSHVLVEKPIAASVSEASQLLDLAKRNQRQLMVGHIERYNSVVISVKRLLSEHKIGTVMSLVTRRCSPRPKHIQDVDVSLDLAIHDVDLANYLLDSLPTSFRGIKRKYNLKKLSDSASYFLEYPTSCAYIHVNWVSHDKVRKLEVEGTNGRIVADILTNSIVVNGSTNRKYTIDLGDALRLEIEDFVDAVLSGRLIDSTHAVEALKIVLQSS